LQTTERGGGWDSGICLGRGMGQQHKPEQRGVAGAVFSVGTSNQISLMKWGNHIKPFGAEKKDIRVLFS